MKEPSRFKTLREFVESRRVTQGDIARELGISESALSTYQGRGVRSHEIAMRLHRDFDISLEGLLDPSSVEAEAAAEKSEASK